MIDSDRKAFLALIADVYSFYRHDFSKFTGNVWWTAMRPYDLAAVNDALGRHCANPDTGQFMPKPADVVKMLQGSTQDSALVAWAKVDKALRQVGTYASAIFDDPLIHRVIDDMGGWVDLGKKSEKEWPFVAKEFENRYRGYRVVSATPTYPGVLIGIAEAQNRQHGMPTQPPVLIGAREACKRVLLGGSDEPLITFERLEQGDMLQLQAPSITGQPVRRTSTSMSIA